MSQSSFRYVPIGERPEIEGIQELLFLYYEALEFKPYLQVRIDYWEERHKALAGKTFLEYLKEKNTKHEIEV